MRFSTFLAEKANTNNEAIFVLHKIISLIDNGHVDVSDSDIRFSVGHLIKQGALNELRVVIRKGSTEQVRVGVDKNGKAAIVVDTKELPDRKSIDTLLSKKPVFDGFVAAFKSYMDTHHNHDAEYEKHENEVALENEGGFNENYEALIAEFKEKNIDVFEKTNAELNSYLETEATDLNSESVKGSIENIKRDILGTTETEFINIVKKLDTYKKFEGVSKELKTKLDSRLKSYFQSTVKPLQN